MSEMKIVSKASHKVLQELNGQKAALTEASVVVIKANMDDVQQIVKDGKNAVITLKNGEKIVIENFFTGVGYETENSLVLNDDDNKLLWAQFTDANGAMLDNITFGYIDTIEPLLYHDGAYSLWGWLAVPLTVAGILIWAGSSSGDDGSDKITRVLDKPEVDPINGKDPITGRGDPDTEIIVTFPDGKTETVTVDKDGTWTAPNPGLEDGDKVVAVAKDKAGNVSHRYSRT
ncbi:hypothetical protein F945_03627 [Acinetobacter rudis CIP 110305]|uniref:Uncharacterized protein n=1 Tax=Acinetobacter rudis CIP 110305 TaxID=421052 RepID=S3MTJ3_9GAMM|nr:BapA prefix-like domain-containing protein [Acinetobacter rudis]EPF69878.1 hypothetical protein F945_03627 [Acinetobacter rudis CIP 110305]